MFQGNQNIVTFIQLNQTGHRVTGDSGDFAFVCVSKRLPGGQTIKIKIIIR